MKRTLKKIREKRRKMGFSGLIVALSVSYRTCYWDCMVLDKIVFDLNFSHMDAALSPKIVYAF